MIASSIAKRYARALLEEAREKGQLEKVGADLAAFVALYHEVDSGLFELMNNPAFFSSERKRVAEKLCKKGVIEGSLPKFFDLLIERDRMRLLPNIKDEYFSQLDVLQGQVRAKIIGADILDNDLVQKIVQMLEARIGKKVIPEVKQDPLVLGGIKAEVDGMVLDGTLATCLSNLQQKLVGRGLSS